MPDSLLLSDYHAPKINGIAAARRLTPTLLENIYQGQIEADERGVTQRFTVDSDLNAAQVRVIRVKPTKQTARVVGASINGGNKPGASVESQTEEVGIDVITVLDQPIDIAQVNIDMIPVDLLKAKVADYGDQVNLNINAMTVAGKIAKTWNAELAGEGFNTESVNFSSGDVQFALLEASAKLDDGDEDHDIAVFPQKGRCFVFRSIYRPYLMKKGVLVLGGANDAYKLLADGSLSVGAKVEKQENGYIGEFDGTPVHVASKQVWSLAAEYLGLPASALDHVAGYLSSHFANARGIHMPDRIKVVEATTFYGVTLLPLTRMGFEAWYAKGNVLIYDSAKGLSENDMFKAIKSVYSTFAGKSYAPGSRMAPSIALTGITSGGFTATGTNTSGSLYYVIGDAKVTDVPTLLAGTSCTSGTAVTGLTIADKKYISVLGVAEDGTIAIGHGQYVA